MKYLILIWSNPQSREIWESMTDEQRGQGLQQYAAVSEELVANGELIEGAPLADVSQGQRVRVTDGRTITTDGPFAEVKEVLAGFYLIDAESQARAVEVAAKLPEASLGLIEVRALMDMMAMEV